MKGIESSVTLCCREVDWGRPCLKIVKGHRGASFIKICTQYSQHHPHFQDGRIGSVECAFKARLYTAVDVCVAVFEFDGEVCIPAVCPAAVKREANSSCNVTSTESVFTVQAFCLMRPVICTVPSLAVSASAAGRGDGSQCHSECF